MARKPDNPGRARRRPPGADAKGGRGEPAAARRPLPLPGSPAQPLLRDPWAWTPVAAVLVLLAHAWGAPLGEPAAEDFDFLHQVLFSGHHSLLDGGGSKSFWRPVAQQLYYGSLGRLSLAHPGALAALHALLLALASLLLYRALRRAWPGPWAAVAGTFPLLSESSRQLIAWPGHSADLGAFLFTALAVHEFSRKRLWPSDS